MSIDLLLLTLTASVLSFSLSSTDGTRVLVLPGNINSHGLYFSKLAESLTGFGHQVHIVAPGNAKLPRLEVNENLTLTTYEVAGEAPFANSAEASQAFVDYAFSGSHLDQFRIMHAFGQRLLAAWEDDCVHLLENERVMEEIRSGRFQFAIMDPLSVNCYYVIPYALDIPYASMSVSFAAWYFRIPRLPSFVSSYGDTDQMTFTQRLLSFVKDFAEMQLVNRTTVFSERYAPQKPPLDVIGLYERSSLWFFLEDLSVGYPRPQMPNSLALGDIMAQPAKPLPNDLQSFLDHSTDGVIVVSFGSFFDYIPEVVARKFCDVFRRIKSRVVWKLKDFRFCSGVENVKLLSWIPQNDLLAHSKVRLFITHGGLNGLVESVYHSKPVIVFPLAVDQPANAVVVQHKGFGIRMNLANFTTEELESNIDRIFTDRSFSDRASFASVILRDKRETPGKRASTLIDHVIKYGDEHLRTGAMKLTPFQFLMFDIYLLICCVAMATGGVLLLLTYCAFKTCRKVLFRRVKQKTA